jgi:hypothetical protein
MFQECNINKRNIGATQSRIDEFCNKIGVVLPLDYQKFLLDFNGVLLDSNPCFYIPEIDKVAELQTLYGLDFDTSQGTCLEKNYNYNFNYDFDGTTLMIGDCYTEGKGGLFIILVSADDDTSGVYVCDLFYEEFFFDVSEENNNTFKIANNFSEFLENLKFCNKDGTVYFSEYNFTYKML